MEREIKFRAWDSHKKTMIAVGYHVIGEVTIFGLIDQYVQENHGEIPSLEYYNYIIESQYTGLTDKKRTHEFPEGQEIYEGDIDEKFGVVKWMQDTCEYGFENEEGFVSLTKNFCESESNIIGNIYEHPELIK